MYIGSLTYILFIKYQKAKEILDHSFKRGKIEKSNIFLAYLD